MIPFPEIVLGHLVGDYLLQNNWMAINKGRYDTLGWLTCFVHCMLYTLAVCLITWTFTWQWMLLVFCSHFFIDKFGLAEKYLKLVKGRSLKNFLDRNYIMTEVLPITTIDAGFTTFVYVVADNTMHLLLMYYGWMLLF